MGGLGRHILSEWEQALSNLTLSDLKQHSNILTNVETFFYFFNLVLFLINSSTLLLQLILYPRQALRLITDPVKGIFVPLIVLSFATILIGTIKYAVPTGHVHPDLIYSLFWVYVAFAITVCFPMLMVWFNSPHDIKLFTPTWAFLFFPMMLVGVVAYNVLDILPPSEPRTIGILLTGYVFQGLGFFMTFFYICIYIIRIITTGFLDGHQANGAFVAVGPPGFTALALMRLGKNAAEILTLHGLVSAQAGEVWLLGAYVPNVGWISTIRELGDIFSLPGFYVWHTIMAISMCLVWLVLFVLTIVAFCKGQIFMAKSEDVIKDAVDLKHEFQLHLELHISHISQHEKEGLNLSHV
ncbi:Malic acid transport protein [Grifola frondosa]|uniref:Malic acid transport protein n=1 Tax=Grifola frondosa TaxID=5627 RepID=A0A1C7MCA5_GRIFR|nr:Malic acid transport protein [Grifola frondosa]